jgi:hypothetical protein
MVNVVNLPQSGAREAPPTSPAPGGLATRLEGAQRAPAPGHPSGHAARPNIDDRPVPKPFNPMPRFATPADGGVAEWSMAAVLKTAVLARVPGVRIPSPPPRPTVRAEGVQGRTVNDCAAARLGALGARLSQDPTGVQSA